MFVVGRGVEFATAREIALKLLETCYVAAEPLAATDLAHGPVAALEPLFPVWAIASADETLPALQEAADWVRAMDATLSRAGPRSSSSRAPRTRCAWLRPSRPSFPPCSPSCPVSSSHWRSRRAKGQDPDQARGLSKVTLAR